MRFKPSPITAVFITVFIDLLGFGLFIPDIQVRGRLLGAEGIVLGALISTYSLFQFIFAPLIGQISDRIGRRTVLLVTILLEVASYAFYAHAAHAILWIFLARAVAGIASGNLGVAYAYTADVLPVHDRAKGIGAVGAALGMGFILGAPLGAMLVQWGGGKPLLLGYTAMGFALINWLYVFLFLPESLKSEQRKQSSERWKLHINTLIYALKLPNIGFLFLLYFTASFAVSNLESTFIQLMYFDFKLTELQGGIVFAYVGFLGACMQMTAGRRMIPKFGEVNMIRAGYILQGPSLALIPYSAPWIGFLATISLYAIGRGISDPAVNTLISKSAPSEIQGGIFGITQSVGALARIISPLIANVLFDIHIYLPYLLAASLLVIPFVGMKRFKKPAFIYSEPA